MAGPQPTLTVGMPVYDGARYLEAAARSVLEQSFRDLELIISDNASSDGTEAIGRALAESDPRVIYRRNPRNIGLAPNFNQLVPLARGRLFKWATADDELRPGYLDRCIAAIDADPSVVLAYPATDFVDADGAPLGIEDDHWHLVSDDPSERLAFALQADGYVNAVLGVFRIDALRRTRLFPDYPGGDFRLMAELSLLGKFVEVEDRLYVRRIHKGSTGGNTGNVRWLRRYWGGGGSAVRAALWRLSRDRVAIVLKAPIPFARKADLIYRLGRSMVGERERLFGELVAVVRR